jgi:phage terminase small subunit|tara:strand:- start:255 stop:1022 length:768 start_codon:yes stop_codon:yes gene_type:complete
MIKKLSKEEISKMNKEELLDEFENIHEEVMKEREFGGTNKPEINLPDATGKQIKFIDLYCSKYGELSATECAIRAGYSRTSAYQRAHELLDFRKNPAVAKVIQDRLMGNMEVWMLDKQKHMANLTRIQQEARAKGQYGVAAKCEELKGKVQGFYVERNLNINADAKINIEEARNRIRKNYDREDYEAYQKRDIEEIFGPEPTPEERKKQRAEKERLRKEGEERMRELEKYQEDRTRERNKKLGLDRKNKLPKFDG